jgi:hypothetical protein
MPGAAKPGPSQSISEKFLEIVLAFLDDNSKASTEITWVPGHGFRELERAVQTIMLASHYRQMCKELQSAWVIEWVKKP